MIAVSFPGNGPDFGCTDMHGLWAKALCWSRKIDSTDAARVFSWRADDFASVALQIQPVNTFIGKQKEWLLELPTFLNRLYQSTWPDGCANLSLRVAKLFVCT